MLSLFSRSEPSVVLRYILFVAQFLGAGFVAGSVVHFGEGVTVWDVSVLASGVLLFTGSTVYRETILSGKNLSGNGLAFLIISSLFLSLAIGMASGGTQHFIDTPTYAAVLIPSGLALGFIAFIVTQRVRLSAAKWCTLILILGTMALALHVLLRAFDRVLPESIRRGHGSEHREVSAGAEGEANGATTSAGDDEHGH